MGLLRNGKTSTTTITLAATIFILAGCSGIRLNRALRSTPQDWTTLGGTEDRTNNSFCSLRPPMKEVWQYNAVSGIAATPVVRDSVVFVGTLQGEFQAVNINDGKRIGYMTMESAVVGTPVLDHAVAIIPLASGTETLVAYDLNGPQRLWSASIGPIESSPLIHNSHVFVTTLEGLLCCLNKDDGSEVWKFGPQNKEDRKPIRSSPSTDGRSVFFGCDDGNIYAVDQLKGELRWTYKTGASVFASTVVASGSVLVGSLDGIIYCLDVVTGNLQWKYNTRSRIYGAVSVNKDCVFFGSADGVCHAVDRLSGTLRWTYRAKSVIDSAPLVVDTMLFVGSLDKILHVLHASTGEELWQYVAPGRIRVSPVAWGGILLVTSEDKYITALRPLEP